MDTAGTDELPERLQEVVERFRTGEERGLARAISAVEDERPGFETLLDVLHEGVGTARRIGVTGPPGAGKSTLTASLARRFRDGGHRVGVLAVDPTSPFSGGALLGDRIRMSDLATEEGIFIRSMANRGSLGGLAAASREAADLMDAFGFDRVILETVGVGQSELAVAGSADTTVVVLVPESGDGVQAMKAGLMEVADVFVVNKADRTGAARLRKEIEVVKRLRTGRLDRLGTGHHGFRPGDRDRGAGASDAAGEDEHPEDAAWDPPVLETVASREEGVDALSDVLDEHFEHLERTGELGRRRRDHLLEQVRAVLERRAVRRAEALWSERIDAYAVALTEGRTTPYAVADELTEAPDEGR